MKALRCLASLAVLAAGCRMDKPGGGRPSSALLYPGARYCETTNSPALLREFFGTSGDTDGEVRRKAELWLGRDHPMLCDPFVTWPLTRVRFYTPDPRTNIVAHCRRVLSEEEWGSLAGASEFPDCACDAYVFGAFRRGQRAFRLYTYGDGPLEDGMRFVVFEFLDTPPEDVLGTHYRNPPRDGR